MSFEITHITSAHTRTDVRIFVKMCKSLVEDGYRVNLLVCDGLGDDVQDGVNIIDCFTPKSRFNRIFIAPLFLFFKAKSLKSHIFHLHDPELLFIGLALKSCGKKVIFDSHEDFPEQILSKHYLNSIVKNLLSFMSKFLEKFVCSQLSGVVAATPYINSKFRKFGLNSINVSNFPILSEFRTEKKITRSVNTLCYVGDISKLRGAVEMVKALEVSRSNVNLNLCGKFIDSESESTCKSLSGWNKVSYKGVIDRSSIRQELSGSSVGLALLHPTNCYKVSYPIKMFEYMAVGLPVIVSDFPLWRQIIEGNKCGVCVNPLDPNAIANAVDFFLENPDIARCMGENGKKLVHDKFDWNTQFSKLVMFYSYIMKCT